LFNHLNTTEMTAKKKPVVTKAMPQKPMMKCGGKVKKKWDVDDKSITSKIIGYTLYLFILKLQIHNIWNQKLKHQLLVIILI